jgi:hypothetical protein
MPTHDAVVFKTFRGTFKTWDQLFAEAAAFATTIGKERLITISHSADHSEGVITVWYWGRPGDQGD